MWVTSTVASFPETPVDLISGWSMLLHMWPWQKSHSCIISLVDGRHISSLPWRLAQECGGTKRVLYATDDTKKWDATRSVNYRCGMGLTIMLCRTDHNLFHHYSEILCGTSAVPLNYAGGEGKVIVPSPFREIFGCQGQKGKAHDNLNVAEFLIKTKVLRVVNSFCLGPATGNRQGDKKTGNWVSLTTQARTKGQEQVWKYILNMSDVDYAVFLTVHCVY